NANQMHLAIHSQRPGFSVEMLTLPGQKEAENSVLHDFFFGKTNLPEEIPISDYTFVGNELHITPFTHEGLEELTQVLEPGIDFPEDFTPAEIEKKLLKKRTFLLGTDKYGRDFLSRILIGIRISLSIGFIAVLISLVIGITLGAVAGYFGGRIDNLIMWLIYVT